MVKKTCATCAHHAKQKFDDGDKVVCVRNPPQVIGAFVPRQGLDPRKPSFSYIFETVYPQPPIPCSLHEYEEGGER